MAQPEVAPKDVMETFVSGVVAFATISIILWLIGVEISMFQSTMLLFAFIGGGLLVRNTIDVSVGFALFTLAIIVALAALAPGWAVEPFLPLVNWVEGLLGEEIRPLDPAQFGIVAVVFTFLMIAFRYKITGKKKFVRPIVDATLGDMMRYVRVYLNIARLAALTFFTGVVIFLQQSAVLAGAAGDVVAEVPVVASNIFAVLAGYLGLGGELPFIGELPLLSNLTAGGFLFLAVLALAVATAARWSSSGPLTQFLRERGK